MENQPTNQLPRAGSRRRHSGGESSALKSFPEKKKDFLKNKVVKEVHGCQLDLKV